jgi:hypothetical protein
MSNERAIELSKLMLWEDGDCKDAADELRRLVVENESLRKNAERWRFAFIQSPDWTYAVCKWDGADWLPINTDEDVSKLDAAIDAAKESK